MPGRLRACGTVALGDSPAIVLDTEGAAHLRGVSSCGSVWLCPVCEQKIQAARRRELETVVEAHGRRDCVMVSLTVRHGRGQSLRQLRAGLTKAATAMCRGRPWAKFATAFGLNGSIRALEVTHGLHGWHPHLHVVWLCAPGWLDIETATVDGDKLVPVDEERGFRFGGKRPDGSSWHDWLIERWRNMVARHVGEKHTPDLVHGLQLSPVDRGGRYLAKLGLEIAPPGTKPGRWGSRSPWQIAAALVDEPNGYDLGLWSEYCEAMDHARRLTWSRGLKARFGLTEQTDEEAAAELPEDASTVCVLDADLWRRVRGYNVEVELPRDVAPPEGDCLGLPAMVVLLEAAERLPGRAVAGLVEFLARAADVARAKNQEL